MASFINFLRQIIRTIKSGGGGGEVGGTCGTRGEDKNAYGSSVGKLKKKLGDLSKMGV